MAVSFKPVLYNGVPLLNGVGQPVAYDTVANPTGPPPECCCPVEDCCDQPDELTATFSGTGGCTPSGSITLTKTSPGIWTGSNSCGDYQLSCVLDDECVNSWALSVVGCPSAPNNVATLDEGTCDCGDTLYLEFTFNVDLADLACAGCPCDPFLTGTIKVVITA